MKARILLSEADAVLRETWAAALEQTRFEVEQALSPRESLYRFCIQTPDLMIFSFDGPAAEGVKTIELMRNFHPSCPLIILASEVEGYKVAARPDVDVVLKKPVEIRELVKAVKVLAEPILIHRMEESGEFVEAELPPTRKRRSTGGRHYSKRAPLLPKTSLQHA